MPEASKCEGISYLLEYEAIGSILISSAFSSRHECINSPSQIYRVKLCNDFNNLLYIHVVKSIDDRIFFVVRDKTIYCCMERINEKSAELTETIESLKQQIARQNYPVYEYKSLILS